MSKLLEPKTRTGKNSFIEEVLTFAHLRTKKNKTDLNAF